MKNIIIVCVIAMFAMACEEVDTSSQKLTDLEACTELVADVAMLYAKCDGVTVTREDMVAGALEECKASLCDNTVETITDVEIKACTDTVVIAGNCEDVVADPACDLIMLESCV